MSDAALWQGVVAAACDDEPGTAAAVRRAALLAAKAALRWQDARRAACAAPMGDKAVWANLGAAETALDAAATHLRQAARGQV